MLPTRTVVWSTWLAELRAAVTDPVAHFFADTSFLFAVASLHASARDEAARWISSLGPDRFHVPVWVGHEIYRRLTGDTQPFTPMARLAGDVVSRLDEVRLEARRFVDDGVAASFGASVPDRDRGAFLIGLDADVSRLRSRLEHLKSRSAGSLDDAADFLARVVNDHVLPSDVYGGLASLDSDYQARLVGAQPPGFKDRRKDDNRYGDLLIWREVVEYCREQGPTVVVMCTNDNKPDWVFTPPQMIDDTDGVPPDRRLRSNKGQRGFKIIVPPPMLVHELNRGRAGLQLHVVNLAMLARLLADGGGAPVLSNAYASLTAAIARDPDGGAEEEEGVAAHVGVQPGRPWPAQATVAQLGQRLRDLDTAAEALVELEALIRGEAVSDGELRAAGGFIVEAAERLEGAELLGRSLLSDEAEFDTRGGWSALFAGLLLTAYLDEGTGPRPRPFGRMLPAIFAAAGHERAEDAVVQLRAAVGDARRRYLLLPGDPGMVDLTVVSTRERASEASLKGLLNGEFELVVDVRRGAPTSLRVFSGVEALPVADFARLVGAYFAVPAARLKLNLAAADRLSWDQLVGFANWGADTGPNLR